MIPRANPSAAISKSRKGSCKGRQVCPAPSRYREKDTHIRKRNPYELKNLARGNRQAITN